mgnify:CR=1 FL=1
MNDLGAERRQLMKWNQPRQKEMFHVLSFCLIIAQIQKGHYHVVRSSEVVGTCVGESISSSFRRCTTLGFQILFRIEYSRMPS